MQDLERDLKARWVPSEAQVAAANGLLASPGIEWDDEGGVYTLHLLVNKSYGWWTEGVQIEHLDGVYLTRDGALGVLKLLAEKRALDGTQVVGGYTWHPRPNEWAVWEDICSEFPKPERGS